jgi:hypothetical protein
VPAKKKYVPPTLHPNKGHEESVAPSKQIDLMITELRDWRGEALADFRRVIRQAEPEMVEEIKWRKPSNPDGVPVWSFHGIVCLANIWEGHARLSFANGGQLKDPKHVFNAAMNGNYLRALDLREGDTFDESAVKELIRAAVAYNKAQEKSKPRK